MIFFSFIFWVCFLSSILSNPVSNKTQDSISSNGLPNGFDKPPVVNLPTLRSTHNNHDINPKSAQVDGNKNNHEDHDINPKSAQVDGNKNNHQDPSLEVQRRIVALEAENNLLKSQLKEKENELGGKVERLNRENAKLEEQLEQSRSLNVEVIILPLLREEISDLEKMYMPPIHLTKDIMMKDLLTSNPNFTVPESVAHPYELSIHYLRWRYILKNCAHITDIKMIKEILMSVGVDDDSIAKGLTIFFQKASERIHGTLKKLTVAEVKKGLIANGMESKNIVNSALAIYAVPKRKQKQLMPELIRD